MARKRRRYIKKKSAKTGLPPGSLVLVGDEQEEKVKISVVRYSESSVESVESCMPEQCGTVPGQITWVRVCGLKDSGVIKNIGDMFGIHPLTMEDIMNTDHLPKMNNFGEYIFIILKSLHEDNPGDGEVDSQQVNVILGRDYVISFQEKDDDLFKPIMYRLKTETARFHDLGTGYLAYALIDVVVDNYFEVLEKIDNAIYSLEEVTSSQYDEGTLQTIRALRREVITVRRAAWPLREVISNLQKRETNLIKESSSVYLSDVYDHVVQIIDTTETFREILSNIFDIFLTGISNRINAVMKVLASIATIIMPMTLVTGLYGMNFKFMPELRWKFGYPMAISLMIFFAVTMFLTFKKNKWL